MRGISWALPLSLIATETAAQTAASTVTGIVVEQSGTAIPDASIAVVDRESGAAVSGGITDKDGRFSLGGLASGDYRILVTKEGFESHSTELIVGTANPVYSIGHLTLPRSAGEIVVTGRAPRVDAGTSVYSMRDNIARSGGSALDALRGVPGVTISEDGEVMLRGSNRVPILIDGKPSAVTGYGNQRGGLESIQAQNIERIEVINNPSARFDSGGVAGVINIVYKTSRKQGLHGDTGLAAGVGALTRRKDDIPSRLGSFDYNPRVAPYVNLTYNKGKVSSYVRGEYIWRRDLPNNEFTTRFYDEGGIRYSQIPENRKQTRVILSGGGDWKVSSDNIVSFAATYDREHHNDFADIPFLDENLDRTRLWFWTEDEVTGFINTSLTFKHQFGPGRHLTANAQYTRGWEDETYFLNEESPVRVGTDQTHIIATEHTIPVSVDYVHPTKSGRFEIGAKFQSRRIPITYDVIRGTQSIIYPGLGRTSNWGERVFAGYANLVHEGSNFAVEGGLRAEHTKVHYDIAEDNIYYPESDRYSYFSLFANARLTYKFSPETRLSLFYNNRVDRPGEEVLRIFPKYDDPELLKVGNPYLRPQFTRTIEARLEHDWGDTEGRVSIYRRRIKDPFTRIYAIDPTVTAYEVINKIYHNTGRAIHTGLEVIGDSRISDRVKLNASFNWYRTVLSAFDVDLFFPVQRVVSLAASKGTAWDGKLGAQIELPGAIKFQSNFIYYSARNVAQGRQSARWSLDLGLTKRVLRDRLELALTATDLFNRFGIEQLIEGEGFDAVYQNFNQTQAITASAKFSF